VVTKIDTVGRSTTSRVQDNNPRPSLDKRFRDFTEVCYHWRLLVNNVQFQGVCLVKSKYQGPSTKMLSDLNGFVRVCADQPVVCFVLIALESKIDDLGLCSRNSIDDYELMRLEKLGKWGDLSDFQRRCRG